MKKIITIAIVVVIVATMFVGCGEQEARAVDLGTVDIEAIVHDVAGLYMDENHPMVPEYEAYCDGYNTVVVTYYAVLHDHTDRINVDDYVDLMDYVN